MDYSFFEVSYTIVVVLILSYFLSRSLSNKPLRGSHFFHWGIFGFVINLYGLSWLYTVYPLEWLSGGALQLVGIGLLHIILSISTAVAYVGIAVCINTKIQKGFLPFLFALSLVVAEVLRSLIISILYYGNDTTISLHFTAGTIGNALSTTPLIEFAYFGGTFALTFVTGYLVYIINTKNNINYYRWHLVFILLLLIGVHYFVPVRLPASNTKLGIVTTNFKSPNSDDEDVYRTAFKEQSKALHQATLSFTPSEPDIIVYPEDTRYFSHIKESEKRDIQGTFASTLFIDGDITSTTKGFSNISVFYIPGKENPVGRGKELLLPFNEYIPFIFNRLFLLFVGGEALETYKKLHTYTPIYSNKTIPFKGIRVGTLICSEILSFTVIENLKKEKPSIVFFQSRLNVFHENPWFVMHLRSFTKVAAAQLRTPIISSTSGAPSYMVSPYGKIEKTIPTGFGTSTYIFK